MVAIASLIVLSCSHPATSDFNVALLTPGPISDDALNAGAYEGLMRIRDSQGAHAAQVETKTRAGFEEAYRDLGSRGHRLAFGHEIEFAYAAASDSAVTGPLRVPRVEFMPDSAPMARS